MKNLVVMAAASLFLFSACEKLSNPADDAVEAKETLEKYADDQIALDGFTDLIQDVMQNEGRLNKNGAYEVFPQEGVISFTDSLFTDGDGIDFVIDLGIIKNNEIPEQSELKKGQNGKFYGGRYNVNMSKPFSEIGCVVSVTPDYSIDSDSTDVRPTWLMFIDGRHTVLAFHNNTTDVITSKGKKLGIPQPIFTITRKGAEKLELFYGVSYLHLDDNGKQKGQWFTRGTLLAERTFGDQTPDDKTDDIYAFSGNTMAIDLSTQAAIYSVSIEESNPLIQKTNCNSNAVYVQGVMNMESSGDKKYRFDFGSGDCDSKVKVKIGNLPEQEVTL